MDGPNDIMTLEQAAEYMQVNYHTLWLMVKRKEIPARKVGREWRILREDIVAFMRNREGGD